MAKRSGSTLESFLTPEKRLRRSTDKPLVVTPAPAQVIDLEALPKYAAATKDEPIELDTDDGEDVSSAQVVETLETIDGGDKTEGSTQKAPSTHASYPGPIASLPTRLAGQLEPSKPPRIVNDGVDLDLLCFEPYLASKIAQEYGSFIRRELPFYRVQYKINRFGKETEINTPRFTVRISVHYRDV